MWFSPEILPVVSIATLSLIVLGTEGTPLSLKVEHVELLITWHFVDERCLDIQLSVRKRAVLFIFTLIEGLRTEFGLVLLDVVESFDLVVREFAVVICALLVRTEIDTIVVQGCTTTPIRSRVILGAPLLVVRLSDQALANFK